mgnify:FL=1
MPETLIILPLVTIPDFLIKEIQSKLAYVDEAIANTEITPSGDSILLTLRHDLNSAQQQDIEQKVQRVVEAMAKNARRLRTQILEDCLDRPTCYLKDPTQELIERGELFQIGRASCRERV